VGVSVTVMNDAILHKKVDLIPFSRTARRSVPAFGALIGISPRTLQNWEQGHRRPEGTARPLIRVAESHPQAVLEALHR